VDACRELKEHLEICPDLFFEGLTACNFFLFPQMKKALKGKRFVDEKEVKEKMMETLKGISLQEF
jgi:hypothetical protein